MGYAIVIGQCYGCGKMLSFNPVRVPSVRDKDGEKQPMCSDCVKSIAPNFKIPDDAYEPINEMELD